jgi:hypothetical protein
VIDAFRSAVKAVSFEARLIVSAALNLIGCSTARGIRTFVMGNTVIQCHVLLRFLSDKMEMARERHRLQSLETIKASHDQIYQRLVRG